MQLLAKKVLISFLLICSAGLALAQGRPIEEGFDYRTLPVAQVVEQKGKVEVLEFFWYGCPHCHDFEPELSAWIKRQSKDVVVRKVPVAFRDDLLIHSQLFYALESLGRSDLHAKVMDAMHVSKKKLLWLKMNKPELARTYWENVLKMDPQNRTIIEALKQINQNQSLNEQEN